MFSPETITTLLIEFYLLGIISHLILLLTVMNATRPADASKRTGQWFTAYAIAASLFWPGISVLLLLLISPIGGWLRGRLERKYGTSGGPA